MKVCGTNPTSSGTLSLRIFFICTALLCLFSTRSMRSLGVWATVCNAFSEAVELNGRASLHAREDIDVGI